MLIPTSVPPAPPQPHATMIQNLSTVLIVTGIVAVLFILPPVRAALRDLLDRVTDFFYGPPADAPSALEATKTQDTPVSATASRREIDDFDLDLFG